jgi:hypothetical protein
MAAAADIWGPKNDVSRLFEPVFDPIFDMDFHEPQMNRRFGSCSGGRG